MIAGGTRENVSITVRMRRVATGRGLVVDDVAHVRFAWVAALPRWSRSLACPRGFGTLFPS
ncbi:hypothetical protein NS226_07780 [Aureimonas ureilytica]|uniref:Uncharacterized protein n=1 Tax=Aureimonas ureilytica TaxID=401562 RepID=A0A175RC98_9HYPH|nr:hypothetical protein NS226_07780 [Aureimonas ureilytica]